jgi:hypothetical protein
MDRNDEFSIDYTAAKGDTMMIQSSSSNDYESDNKQAPHTV